MLGAVSVIGRKVQLPVRLLYEIDAWRTPSRK